MTHVQMRDGILILDGKPHYLSSADYPYYRDRAEIWEDRLEKLSTLGHKVVSCYIPWRHHEIVINGKRRFDFSGTTQSNRDVIEFLNLCQQKEFLVIVKPGPFIHAETNYGGLPDFVCPLQCPDIEAMFNHADKPMCWPGNALTADGSALEPWPLPAPLDLNFLAEVERWLGAVAEDVLRPFASPDGPIIVVQLANEGIYSNAQYGPWAYDYSQSSLVYYRQCLQAKYRDLDRFNRLHATHATSWDEIEPPRKWISPSRLEDVLVYEDWSAYQAEYMREIYRRLARFINIRLPYVVNVNPPLADNYGVDAWLSRVNPDVWPNIHYGFTNWIGVACEDPTVVERYQVMVKRSKGVNLEENWGFSDLYDPAFAFDTVSYHQTLLTIALGAAGYNIYTGVRTADWDVELDRVHCRPYPASAPVNEVGELTPQSQIVSLMNDFFIEYGTDFLETQPTLPVAWGIYMPYAHIQAWLSSKMGWKDESLGLPECGQALLHFQRQLLDAHIDFGLINLQAVSAGALQQYPLIVTTAGCFMDRATQEKLLAHMNSGRKLIIIGELPELDEELADCKILKDHQEAIAIIPKEEFYQKDILEVLVGFGLRRTITSASSARLWLYSHPTRDIQYLFVLTPRGHHGSVDLRYECPGGFRRLQILLPGGSGGVVRIVEGRLSAALLKGINDYVGEHETPCCRLDGSVLSADVPCDLFVAQQGNSYTVRVTGAKRGQVFVQLPNGTITVCPTI